MTNNIIKAKESEIESVLKILNSCTNWLCSKGMNHWQGAHTEDSVSKKIKEKEVYIIVHNNLFAGTITISTNPPKYHNEEDQKFWKEPNGSAIYVSGLCVIPEYQNKGLAKKLLKFAEKEAKNRKMKYLRLDAVSNYVELTEFYLKRGYVLVGKRQIKDNESNFFEKEI